MSAYTGTIETGAEDRYIVERCGALGLPVALVDLSGRIRARHCDEANWLTHTLLNSGLFAQGLLGVAPQWHDRAPAEPSELWPGCWVVPLAIQERRRVIGYRVVVVLTERLLDSEQLHRLVASARLDYMVACSQIGPESLWSERDLPRLAQMLNWTAHDLHDKNRHAEEINTLSQQLAEAYEEISLVYKLSAKMTVTADPEPFLEYVLSEMQQVIGLRWMVMQLNDTDDRLQELRGRTFVAGDPPFDEPRLARAARKVGALWCGKADSAQVVFNPADLGDPDLAGVVGTTLLVPLVRDDRPLGIIIGTEKIDSSDLSSVDSKLATSLGQSVGIFLENAMLFEDVQDMFMGTLRTLVSAIDAKDTYTCGHSERVAWLGRELAEAAGLDAQSTQRLYLAGLLHDIGKIGIPESVLAKPGRLTDEEFDIIKTHPRIGARILQDIRQMQDLIPGVLYHHERFDGGGYPDGLSGENIPLFGRVLCLADSFDAMSSTRTYRAAMDRQAVLEEILNCAGKQFDPKLAEVFVNIDFALYDQMIHNHQQRQSPLIKELGGLSG